MANTYSNGAHTFHIPVMGTGFTIDTPLRVAKYGISSVISLVDDILIEQMRKVYCEREGEPYTEIKNSNDDARAERITAYLNLVDRIVSKQVKFLQSSPFEKNSEITRYFEMLPNTSLKQDYTDMIATSDIAAKTKMQDALRPRAIPGSIDVNIMTKLDRNIYRKGEMLPAQYSDALSGLRGFAQSTLKSSIVCSAGMNQRFYSYFAEFQDFFPDSDDVLNKKITLKVSDFRSAAIQGRFLAKKGLWVSEYRIESGLNCGGHAFPTNGHLMGPILEEFKNQKAELSEKLHKIYNIALTAKGKAQLESPPDSIVTVQGGIGTSLENNLLLRYYNVDRTGWGTPFLLVPEVVNIDDEHLEKLVKATDDDVYISESSPLGVPFWNLRSSASEAKRLSHIDEGKPGSPCPKGYIRFNSEFTKFPVCISSSAYQKLKINQLKEDNQPSPDLSVKIETVMKKSCICHDLGGSAKIVHKIEPNATPAICCGPNIINFSKVTTLEEMVSNIYNTVSDFINSDRPHMLIKEIKLYVDYLMKEADNYSAELSNNTPKYLADFKKNLLAGIEYYHTLGEQYIEDQKGRFLNDLKVLQEEIEGITFLGTVES